MTARRRLPHRRSAVALGIEHAGHRYRMHVGYFPDGAVGEVFLDAAKQNSTLDAFAADAAILLSLLLQHGAPLAGIGHSLRRSSNGAPASLIGAVVDKLHATERQQDRNVMTPSVASASPTVAPVAPFAVVSTADREWWAEEAVRAGTSGLVAAVVAASMEQPQLETITPLDAPSGVRPPPNITAIGWAVSLSRSSRSDWSVCADSWRTAFRWSAFMTRSAATGRRRPAQSRPSSTPSESTARRGALAFLAALAAIGILVPVP
jgi:hypothetical protein